MQAYAYYSNLLVTAPYLATGLPPGLAIDPATGLITGTPTTTGLYWPTFQLDLPVPAIARLSVPWTITPLDGTAVSLPTPGNQNDSVVASPVSLALHGSDSDPTAQVSYTASGLPPGPGDRARDVPADGQRRPALGMNRGGPWLQHAGSRSTTSARGSGSY